MATRYLDIDGLDTVAQTVRYLDHVAACGPRNTDALWDLAEYFGEEQTREDGRWVADSDSPLDFASALYGPYGRHLLNLYNDEIGDFVTGLEFLIERCRKNDFSGLHVGDFLMTEDPDGEAVAFQIAGFNVYRDIAHANGLIADDTGTVTLLADRCHEYDDEDVNSTAYWAPINFISDWYGTELYEARTSLLNIPMNCESVEGGNFSTGATAMKTGRLWAPSEIEVWGSRRVSGPTTDGIEYPIDECQDRQLPIFASGRSRVFGAGGSPVDWMTRNPQRGQSALAGVSSAGEPCSISIDNTGLAAYAPVGFHLGYLES